MSNRNDEAQDKSSLVAKLRLLQSYLTCLFSTGCFFGCCRTSGWMDEIKPTQPQQHLLDDILVTIFEFLSKGEIFKLMLVNRDWLRAVQVYINHNGLEFLFTETTIDCCYYTISSEDVHCPPDIEQSLHRFIDRHYHNTHNTRVQMNHVQRNRSTPWMRAVYDDVNRIGGRVLAWKFKRLDVLDCFPKSHTPEAAQCKQITELKLRESNRNWTGLPYQCLQYFPNLQTLEIRSETVSPRLITALSTYGIRLSKLIIDVDYPDDTSTQLLEYTAELDLNGVVLKRHPSMPSPEWYHCISSARLTSWYDSEAVIQNTPKNRLSIKMRVSDEILKAVLRREEIAEINAMLKQREPTIPTNSGQDTTPNNNNNEASSSAMQSHSHQHERHDETDESSVIDAAWRVWRNLLRGLDFDFHSVSQASAIVEYLRLVAGIGVLLASQHNRRLKGPFQTSKLRVSSRRSKIVLKCLHCLECIHNIRHRQNKVEGEEGDIPVAVAVAEKDAEQQDVPFVQRFLDNITNLVISDENHVLLSKRYAHRLPQLNDLIISECRGSFMDYLQNDITFPSLYLWLYDLYRIVKYTRRNKVNVQKLTIIVDELVAPYLLAMIRCVQEFSLEQLRIIWDEECIEPEWTAEETELLKRFLQTATNNKIPVSVGSFCRLEDGVSRRPRPRLRRLLRLQQRQQQQQQQQSDNNQSGSAVNDISPANGHRNPEDSLSTLDKCSTLLEIHDSAVCDALLRNTSSYPSLTSLVIKSRSALPRGFLGSFPQLEHVQIDYSPDMLSQPQYLSATNEEHSKFQLQRLVIVFDDDDDQGFDLTEPLICPIAVETLVLRYQPWSGKSVLVLLHLRQLIDAAHRVLIADDDNNALDYATKYVKDIRDMAALIYPTKEIEVEEIEVEKIDEAQERMWYSDDDEEE